MPAQQAAPRLEMAQPAVCTDATRGTTRRQPGHESSFHRPCRKNHNRLDEQAFQAGVPGLLAGFRGRLDRRAFHT